MTTRGERPRLFGTDGLRGVANDDLSVETVTALGRAAATVLGRGHHRPVFVVGGDTRASTDFLGAALVAGLCSAGADVLPLGVVPTGGVAYCTAAAGAEAGAVISASHNPFPDNGVKFFGGDGYKLDDRVEDEIQDCFESQTWSRPTGGDVGRLRPAGDLARRYADHLVAACPAPLGGLRVVLDCANGAAFEIAPRVLEAAGAEVEAIFVSPDGVNVNEGCGSTHVEALAREVVSRHADLGLALDGDADRVLAVDSSGALVDGDQILAITALDRHARGALRGDAVVATVMSNLGFHRAMEKAGVTVYTTKVGDRYVLEALRGNGLEVGGEQSGHVLYLDQATTGDGIVTALQLCGVVSSVGRPLHELAAVVERYPQVLINVGVGDKRAVAASESVKAAVAAVEARLGAEGRVLLRPSGTESKVRVMVEAADEATAREAAEELAVVVRNAG